jgi:hypothetical protein
MSPSPDYETDDVDAGTLRGIFNEARFEERLAAGELTASVRPDSEHLARSMPGEPPGTISHIVRYFDRDGRVVAIVHEYILPDGSRGGSGRPDPKWVRIGAKAYKLKDDP